MSLCWSGFLEKTGGPFKRSSYTNLIVDEVFHGRVKGNQQEAGENESQPPPARGRKDQRGNVTSAGADVGRGEEYQSLQRPESGREAARPAIPPLAQLGGTCLGQKPSGTSWTHRVCSAVPTGPPQTQSRPENGDREGLRTWASLPFF